MIDKILAWLKDSHVPCSMAVFLIGCVMQWFHRLDPTFVAYTGTVLGAITGHAFINRDQGTDQKLPDDCPK